MLKSIPAAASGFAESKINLCAERASCVTLRIRWRRGTARPQIDRDKVRVGKAFLLFGVARDLLKPMGRHPMDLMLLVSEKFPEIAEKSPRVDIGSAKLELNSSRRGECVAKSLQDIEFVSLDIDLYHID